MEDLTRLRQYQALPLENKIQNAKYLIQEALAKGEAAVAWSGGKDSTVLLHLVLPFQPSIVVIWNNTGVEFPETWPFIKKLRDEWGLNLHITKPAEGIDFWWGVKKYGWPLLGKGIKKSLFTNPKYINNYKGKVGRAIPISSYCCDYLKERPSMRKYRELGIKVTLNGNMVAESRQRFFTWLDYGEFSYASSLKLWRCWPLWCWKDDDIWAYHEKFNLPHCAIYDKGHKRNGCWPCGMDLAFPGNHLAILRLSHPKLWHFLMIEKGLGADLLKAKIALRDGQGDFWAQEKVEVILKQRPCYFDRL